MFHALIAIAVLSQSASSSPVAPRHPAVWTIGWQVVFEPNGRASRVPVFGWGASDVPATGIRFQVPSEIATVAALEEHYRHGQLAREGATLDRILSPDYYETDADGRRRDKAQAIRFALDANLTSFRDSHITASGSTNAVVIMGEETAVTGAVARTALFTHVYARASDGEWQLISATQVRSVQ